jgi:hypothetical protein
MYPDLSYFLHDVFGTAPDNWTSVVKTFGFFLALSFLTAAYLLFLELKRKKAEGLPHTLAKMKRVKCAKPTLTSASAILRWWQQYPV